MRDGGVKTPPFHPDNSKSKSPALKRTIKIEGSFPGALKRSFPPLKWRAPTDLLILLLGLPRGKPVLRRSRRMAAAIILEIGVGDTVMRAGRMIFICGQLAAELHRANVGRVLVADAAAIEGFVGDRQRELADFVCGLADCEGVFADESLNLE